MIVYHKFHEGITIIALDCEIANFEYFNSNFTPVLIQGRAYEQPGTLRWRHSYTR